MIGSLFDDLQPLSNPEDNNSELTENLSDAVDADDHLLTALPLVQKIVRHKTAFSWHSEASDLIQGIALRLLKWRNKYREKSEAMSSDEWQSFAAKTAYNEINRHYSTNNLTNVPLESVRETAAEVFPEGQSESEVRSLVIQVWQKICNMTLRQRQALIFGSQELVIYLLKCGITDEELAGKLSLTMEEWADVKNKLPLKSIQIAQLLKEAGNQNSVESIIKSIKKARYEARAKVRRLIEK